MPGAGAGVPAAEGAVLYAVVTGLIARVEASPLLRRAPAACTPEEQARMVTLLNGLSRLRETLSTLAGVSDVPAALVDEAWPELAAALAASALAPRPTQPRGSFGPGSPRPARSPSRRTKNTSPPTGDPSVETPVEARAPAEVTVPPALPEQAQNLRAAVQSILRADTHPLSGARIATLVQEVAPRATREQVYDTLYHSADLFRKTSQGWELVPR